MEVKDRMELLNAIIELFGLLYMAGGYVPIGVLLIIAVSPLIGYPYLIIHFVLFAGLLYKNDKNQMMLEAKK